MPSPPRDRSIDPSICVNYLEDAGELGRRYARSRVGDGDDGLEAIALGGRTLILPPGGGVYLQLLLSRLSTICVKRTGWR